MVKEVFLYCALVVVLLRSAESSPNKLRVIGGVPVKPGQFPFLVSIQYYQQHFCGGSIISKTVVLTAAHCLDGKSAQYMSIVAGTHDLLNGGERIAATDIQYHHNYNKQHSDSDIGLVFLSRPLTFSSTIQPAQLSSANEDNHNSQDYAIVAGWGTTSAYSGTTTTARYTTIPLWGRQTCLMYLPHLTKNMICAGSFDGQKNSCPGDSGGPLIKGNKVIGTVSYGFGCGTPRAPAVYASVSDLRNWISLNANV